MSDFNNFLPRERLARLGARALADKELLAVMLGSGSPTANVFKLSDQLLPIIDQNQLDLSPSDLSAIPGIGGSKAAMIVAALEFSRRRIRPEGTRVTDAKDIFPLLRHLADRKQEMFITISLNGAHEVIHTRVVTIGLVNSSQVHPREVLADIITDRAASLVVAHNHPSGNVTPSPEDRIVTKRLRSASQILGITLLDHIIFSPRAIYSFHQDEVIPV